jgi:hypothetical protein
MKVVSRVVLEFNPDPSMEKIAFGPKAHFLKPLVA